MPTESEERQRIKVPKRVDVCKCENNEKRSHYCQYQDTFAELNESFSRRPTSKISSLCFVIIYDVPTKSKHYGQSMDNQLNGVRCYTSVPLIMRKILTV